MTDKLSNDYEAKRLEELKDMSTSNLIKLLTQFAWWEKPHTIVHQTLIQAADALAAMEWRDIKDIPDGYKWAGNKVDLCVVSKFNKAPHRIADARFIEGEWCYCGTGSHGNPHDTEWREVLGDVTHYMPPPPLPTPPETGK